MYNRKYKYYHRGHALGSQIKDILKELDNIFNKNIIALKSYSKNIDTIFEEIRSKITRSYKRDFTVLWEAIPDNYKNLYYLYLCLSSCLSKSYSALDHMSALPIVDKYSDRALKQYEKDNKSDN